jgi:serine protease
MGRQRNKQDMHTERRETESDGSRETPRKICRTRSKLRPGSLFLAAACLSLPLALVACGGSNGTGASSEASPSAGNTAEVVAAASAASSNVVSMQTASMMNTSSLAPDASVDRFIVKYKSGTAERGAASAVQSKLDRLAAAFPAKARHLRRMGTGSDVITTARRLNVTEAKAFMRAIASDPNVEYVEPDAPMSGSAAPNDPLYSLQWGLVSNLDPGQTYAGIRAEGAWSMANGSGVVIGLVDNGVTNHSDLNANILPGGYDFTYDNAGGDGTNPGLLPGYACSVSWHGTHVAGTLAAVSNNGTGIAGVASGAKVISARALNGCANGSVSGSADAIVWAAGGTVPGAPVNTHPAKVINASLGGVGSCSATYQSAIDYATSQGAVVVVAAMNNSDLASKYQPANCRNVITVGNSQRDGSRYIDSNFGPTVDIAAPGTDTISTFNAGTSSRGAESYASMSGTSMSAPLVSGVVALAQSVAPTPLTAPEMRTLIQQNAQRFPPTLDYPLGAGILDATATVTAAKSGKIPAAADFTCSEAPNLMQVTCKDLSTARGEPIRTWTWNFGTGDPAIVRTQSVTPYMNYEYPGTYDITFTVTDSNGAVSRVSRPFQVLPPTLTGLSFGVPVSISSKNFDMQNYQLVVPAGAKSMTFTLSPGNASQIASLYVRAGTPSMLNPDCLQAMRYGNVATCTIPNPAAGTYYAIVSASSKLSDVSLLATYTK